MTQHRWWPVAAWVGLIELLTTVSIPSAATEAAPEGSDKAVHVVLYAVLGALAHRAVAGRERRGPPLAHVVLVVAGLAIFGAFDEWHQQFFPERSMELGDWIADVVGGASGVFAYGLVASRVARRGGAL